MKKKILCAVLGLAMFVAGFGVGKLTTPAEEYEQIDYDTDVPVIEILHYESVAAVDIYGNEWVVDVNLVDSEPIEYISVAKMLGE